MADRKEERRLAPREEREKVVRTRTIRFFIHLLGWTGILVLYYVAFSFFFDTPLEYQMKSSTSELRRQYQELSQRYDSIDMVIRNVVERDRNVFRILFESDPYNLASEQENRWLIREKFINKSHNELSYEMRTRVERMEKHMKQLEWSYDNMLAKIAADPGAIDRIPAIQPVNNPELTLLTASYGLRIHPFYKTLSSHMGVDYTVPEGSRVFATADGRISEVVRRSTTSGLSITINHGNGYETMYSHLSRINVQPGQNVKRGDIIAWSGNTGLSLAPHLHYEVRKDKLRVDPVHYFFMELSPAQYRQLMEIALSGMQSFD